MKKNSAELRTSIFIVIVLLLAISLNSCVKSRTFKIPDNIDKIQVGENIITDSNKIKKIISFLKNKENDWKKITFYTAPTARMFIILFSDEKQLDHIGLVPERSLIRNWYAQSLSPKQWSHFTNLLSLPTNIFQENIMSGPSK